MDQSAASGDTIFVAQGTYTKTSVRPRNDIVASGSVTQVVYISKSLTIQGGYTSTDNFTSHLPLSRLTTIDAQNKGRGVYIASGGTGRLFDLRLIHGNANGMGGGATPTRTPAAASMRMAGSWSSPARPSSAIPPTRVAAST